MKTLKQISEEIADTEKAILAAREILDTKAERKRTKTLLWLRQVERYLKTGVSEDNLKKQLSGLLFKIQKVEEGYAMWDQNQTQRFKNPRAAYNSEMGLADLLNKKMTLEYLLS